MDTGAFFALSFTGDENHRTARSIYQRLNRIIALRVLESVDQSGTRIVRVTASDERSAREILRRYRDKDFSLTDATSFVVMERLGIATAFAFDRHFAQYGLALLSPPRP